VVKHHTAVAVAAEAAAETAVGEAAAVVAKTKRLDLQIKNVLPTAERFLFRHLLIVLFVLSI